VEPQVEDLPMFELGDEVVSIPPPAAAPAASKPPIPAIRNLPTTTTKAKDADSDEEDKSDSE
jgi:hypothetical protein